MSPCWWNCTSFAMSSGEASDRLVCAAASCVSPWRLTQWKNLDAANQRMWSKHSVVTEGSLQHCWAKGFDHNCADLMILNLFSKHLSRPDKFQSPCGHLQCLTCTAYFCKPWWNVIELDLAWFGNSFCKVLQLRNVTQEDGGTWWNRPLDPQAKRLHHLWRYCHLSSIAAATLSAWLCC